MARQEARGRREQCLLLAEAAAKVPQQDEQHTTAAPQRGKLVLGALLV